MFVRTFKFHQIASCIITFDSPIALLHSLRFRPDILVILQAPAVLSNQLEDYGYWIAAHLFTF